MNSQSLELLKQLADRLGIAITELIAIFTRQCVARGIYHVIACTVAMVLLWYFYPMCKRFYAQKKASIAYRHDDELLTALDIASRTLMVLIVIMWTEIHLYYALHQLLSPAACAVESITNLVK